MSIKIAHKFEIDGEFQKAIDKYIEIGISNPELTALCEKNILRLRNKPSKNYLNQVVLEAINNDSECVYSSENDSFESWVSEFGPGKRIINDSNQLFLSSENRFFISKKVIVEKNSDYRIQVSCQSWSEDVGSCLAIVNCSEVDTIDFLAKNIPLDGFINININTSGKEGYFTIRVGLGTTANIERSASIIFSKLKIFKEKKLPSNRSIISSFAKNFIDPELLLPSILGLNNDFSFIKNSQDFLNSFDVKNYKKISLVIIEENLECVKNIFNYIFSQKYPKELIEVVLIAGSKELEYEEIFNCFSGRGFELYFSYLSGASMTDRLNFGVKLCRNDMLIFLNSHSINQHTDPLLIEHLIACHCVSEKVFSFDLKVDDDILKKSSSPFIYVGRSSISISKKILLSLGGFSLNLHDWENLSLELSYRFWCHGCYLIPTKGIIEYKDSIHYANEVINLCPNSAIRPFDKKETLYKVPLISIYVPAFNVEKYIEECIESVLSQTYHDFELIVVNDGSVDKTWDLLQKYKSNPRIKLFNKENGGIGSASNYALNHALGELIVQLDSDDLLLPTALESIVKFYLNNPLCECLYSNYELIDEESRVLKSGWSPSYFDRYDNLIGMSVPHLRSYRKSVYFRTVGFDENLLNAVDYDFFLKLSNVAKIHFLPKILYRYRVHSTQTSTAKKIDQVNNHQLVVQNYLNKLGFNNFYVKAFNPFKPRQNYIVKKGSSFESKILDASFEQPVINGLMLSKPKCVGNDYSDMQKFVTSFYENNEKNYCEFVSIIVPVYNRYERLSRCLAGIVKQTYPCNLIEVVIVDDGSSDAVLQVVSKYSQFLKIKYVKQYDAGYRLSAARNLGIRSSSYRNISIIDCDLIPLPIFIESFMQYLHHYENVVLLGHQRFVDPSGISDDEILSNVSILSEMRDIESENSTMQNVNGITKDWRYELYKETDFLKKDQFPYRAFSSGHVAYRKKLIEEAGYYDEDFNVWGCEDNEAGYRLYQNGCFFIPVLEAIDLHQEPPSGKNETNRELDRIISRNLLQSKLPAMRGWFGERYNINFGVDIPLISVCIPVYNTGLFAKLAVESVLNQSLQDFEVIIYDDASTDETLSILEDAFFDDERVRIIKGMEHKNVTFARNELIKNSRGEFIGFLDSDDLLKPNCLAVCVEEFRKSPAIGLVCTGYEKINEFNEWIEVGWRPNKFDREALMFGNIFTHFRIFRVRDWNRSRKWNAFEIQEFLYGEDWDLCLKLAEVTEFSRIDQVLYQYRIRNSNITNSSDADFKFRQTAKILKSWIDILGFKNFSVVQRDPKNPSSVGYYALGAQS